MSGFANAFFTNEIFLSLLFSVLICQALKFIIRSITDRRLAFHVLVENGGMPSGHSSFVSALTTTVGLVEGFASTLFFVSLAFSLIVLRDAFGVRHSVDRNIAILNQLISKEHLKTHKIEEIVGHTPKQVAAGVVVGVLISLLVRFVLF